MGAVDLDRHYLDHVNGSPPVSTYGVWRHVPGTIELPAVRATASAELSSMPDRAAVERLRAALPAALGARVADGRLFLTMSRSRPAGIAAAFPPGTWELVASVPAVQHDQYVAAIPTISNAAANDFVTTAHTITPSIWFIAGPISGQSGDNLPPAQPTQFTAAYAGGQTHLEWSANSEPDLASYSLYRGTSADFTPAIGNRIASQTATSYDDVGPAGRYYKLSAVDLNGNESGIALITPQTTLGAEGDPPVTFALEGVRPNPARGRHLRVAFALPSNAPARLELLDVRGRRLHAREVGSLGAGRHAVNLAEGRSVPAGIYWVRLTQGPNRRAARTAVIE